MLVPSNRMRPRTTSPGGMGIRRITERAVTVFPEPDSPTRPKVSPRWTVSVTPSTCCQLATFEMKANGEIVQLQNGVRHIMSPLQRVCQGAKRHNSRSCWHGGCCTLGRLGAHVKGKTCTLQAALPTHSWRRHLRHGSQLSLPPA